MIMLDFGDVMDEFIFNDFDGNLEEFNFIMNIIDDKTYGLVTKFFVIMERILGGCTLNHVVFNRKKQKIIVEDEWHNLQAQKERFEKAYNKIKECFIVDKEELEGLLYDIDEIE